MKLQTINKIMLILSIICLNFFLFLTPHKIHASPNHTLKRCNAFKYDENNNLISIQQKQLTQLHLSTISTLNINKQTKITKIFQLIHKIFHCGIDILTITNEIIDLQNN